MQAGKERRKLSSCHPTSPHRPAGTGFGVAPGPRVLLYHPGDPRVRDPALLPGRGEPTPSPPGIETGPSGGLAPWRRAVVRLGGGGTRPPPSSAGRLADWFACPWGPRRKGPATRTPQPPPDQPRRRRGRPPRPGAESRLFHRLPPPPRGVAARGRLTAPRGFQGLQRQQ